MATSSGEKAKTTIVIKRIKKVGHGTHGAAWKIAYADFVTAMMAFFLLMWLLGSTTKGDLQGIADYFQSPLQVAMSGGSGSGASTSLVPGAGGDPTREIGKVLNGVDNKIALTGHTDSTPYSGGQRWHSNWELSADRANASRRELIAGGMDPQKIARVVGLADSNLLDKVDARNPLNRRISIIVLNKIAEERLERARGEIEAGDPEQVSDSLPERAEAAAGAQGADAAATAPQSPAAAPTPTDPAAPSTQ